MIGKLLKYLMGSAPAPAAANSADPLFAQRVEKLRSENAAMALSDQMEDIYGHRLRPSSRKLRYGLWAVAGTLAIFVGWASMTSLDEVTRGMGTIIPSSRAQLVQAAEAGVIAEIMVREGQEVSAGQPLVRIDDVKLGATVQESQAQIDGLQAAAARLRAEVQGVAPAFPIDLQQRNPLVVATERATWDARRLSLQATVDSLRQQLNIARQELAMTEPLAAQGLVSDLEVLRIKRSISEAQGRISDAQTRFRSDAAAEMARVEAQLGESNAVLLGKNDAFNRAIVRAPKRGVVKNLHVNTLGAVVQPGEQLLEIVPIDETLLVETRIRPNDIAFLRPGLKAEVKLTAYDSAIYGWLEGEIVQISPDTLHDEVRKDETYYKALVRTRTASLQAPGGKRLPVIPGMQASVDIKTGRKSVLSYLFKPVLRAREALRER